MGATIMPFPYHQFFDNNGDPGPSYRLFTYVAGTSTKEAVWTDNQKLVAHTNPITLNAAGRPPSPIFLDVTKSYKLVFAAAGADDPPASPIWTVDNVMGVPEALSQLDVPGVAGMSIGSGEFVYLSAGDGGRTAGRWYLTDADQPYSSVTASAIGYMVAPSLATTGTDIIVRLSGETHPLTLLTEGTLYYISATAGAVTATPPTNARAIGQASNSLTLNLTSWVPIPDASATWGGRVSTGTQTFAGTKTFNVAPAFWPGSISASVARVSGVIAGGVTFANVGNVGAGEDNLHSYSLTGGSLAADGQALRITAWGTYAANANSKRVRAYFGATVLVDSAAATTNGGQWRVEATIVRTAAATQRAVGHYVHTDAAGAEVHAVLVTAPAETLSGAVVVKLTGEGVADNDIIQSVLIPEVVG